MRLLVRLVCFVSAIVLLWPVPFWPESSKYFAAASPFVTVSRLIATGAFEIAVFAGIFVAVITAFKKRWFCRYVCPVGLLQDGAIGIGISNSGWWSRCPPIGRYIALATVAGALVGYPILLWLDPLAIFSNAFSIRNSSHWHEAILSVSGLIFILLIALTSGSLWCSRICPLGATQEFLDELKHLLTGSSFRSGSKNVKMSGNAVTATRRAFLAVGTGLGLGLLAKNAGSARGESSPLRPPGSITEEKFSGICVRCGNCVRACPSNIIHPDTGQAGILGFLAPVIRFEMDYCLENCGECMLVCPSGALQDLTLDQKRQYTIGEALIDGKICFLVQGRSDCDVCVRACPFDAIEIYWDEDRYIAYPHVDFGKCNGCGACQVYCPTGDVKAVRVWKSQVSDNQEAHNSG